MGAIPLPVDSSGNVITSSRTFRHRSGPLAVLAVVIVLLVPVAGDATTVASGSADASSTLVRLVTGIGTVSVASDDAQARIGASPRAYARFISGTAADQTVGAAERTTTTQGSRQTATLGDGSVAIGDLLSIGTAGANVSAEIADGATSSVEAQIADASLFGGWLAFDGGISSTTARALADGSSVHRQIALGGVRALPIGALLAALDISPLDLTCEAIEKIGTDVGHDSTTCATLLATANDTIAAAIAALHGTRDSVLAQRDAITAAIGTAQGSLAPLEAGAAADQAQIAAAESALAGLTAQRADMAAQVTALEDTVADLEASHDEIASQVAALQAQTNGTTRAAVQASRATVTSCDGLTGLAGSACQATLTIGSFPALATTYGVNLTGLSFSNARAALLTPIDALLAAFDTLDATTAQLSTVDAQLASVNADLATAHAGYDGVVQQITTTTASLADVNADLAALTTQIDDLNAQIDELNAQLDQMINALAVIDASSPTDTTCLATAQALATVEALEPSLANALSEARAQVNVACASLKDSVEALLAIPLITVDGVTITLDVSARADGPAVVVTGTLGSLKIGENVPIVLDMPAGSDEIPAAQALIAGAVAAITSDTGFGLPVPAVEFLSKSEDAGRDSDGTWYARGSITFLKLTVPAGSVTMPDAPPLGSLDGESPALVSSARAAGGAAAAGSFGVARGVLAAGSFDTQPIELDLGTFDANGTYLPAAGGPTGGGGGDGGSGGSSAHGGKRLPKTGEGFGLLLPALCFLGAGLLARRLGRA